MLLRGMSVGATIGFVFHFLLLLTVALAALITLAVVLIALGHIGGMGWSLYPAILKSRRAIRKLLRVNGYGFIRVSSLGASSIDPKYFCVCIDVVTDEERDALIANEKLTGDFRDALIRSGYPEASVPS